MYDTAVPKLYQEIKSDNYLVNCYKYLLRSKSIFFIFILIEMVLNIIQELETFINGFNSESNQNKLYYVSYITNQFDKLAISLKIIIILLFIIIPDSLYFVLCKNNFKKNYLSISIISNALELFYFRTILLILLNLFFTLPNIYFLISFILLIPHIYLIINNFIYNHLYYFVPIFIEYSFDEFTSLFDIILIFFKIFLSVACNSRNNVGKFCFIILIVCQIFFSCFFIYKLKNHSYLFMKNSFLNKTKVIFFFANTIIIIIALLFGKDEIITILFLILSIGIFFIIMVYMYLMYNPFHFIRINRDTPIENIFFYLYILSEKNDLEFLIENEINEHYEKCGVCSLCKKYIQYLDIYNNLDEKEDDEEKEKEKLINNKKSKNIINDNNNIIDLFDIIYDGNNKYFELIRKITLNYKNIGKDSFFNNSYYYINISFLIYSDYQKNNITLYLNEKILLEEFNSENKLLDNHELQINQILFCNKFMNLGNKILTQLKDILKCEQKKNKAKKLIDLSALLKEMQKPKYKNYLFSHKQENISNSRNLIMACSLLYEEIFNTTINNSQMPLRENIQPLEDIFRYNSNKIDKAISLLVNLTNNSCKIIRAGKDLSFYKNNNLFDLFPLIFKEYQINLFLYSILDNFDKNITKESKNMSIGNTTIITKYSKKDKEHKKNIKPRKQIYNDKNKREYVEIKVIICENISSKIFYRLLTLKLSPLYNNDYNSYFILFDGLFFLHKNTIITLQDFEEGNNPIEKILAVSDPELENMPEIYSMNFQKYSSWQNNKGYITSPISKFNLSTKLYSIYSIIKRSKDTLRKKIKRNNSSIDIKTEDDLEDEEDANKKLVHKTTKMEKFIEDNASVASQQTGSSYNNGISGIGIRNKKKDNIHEYNSLNKIRKIIYFSIPFILLSLIIEFIYLKSLEKDIHNNNKSYIQFREFYSLYFQLFTSILGNACIKTDNGCKDSITIYSEQYFSNGNEYFNFPVFIRGQAQELAAKIMDRRNNLINIHKNIGNKKYNELFSQQVEYLRISQSYGYGKIIFSLSRINIEFSEAILIICNSFQIMSNNTSNDSIFFLNKLDGPFSLLNEKQNEGKELTQYQKEIYEMILNYKIYREQFNNINEKIFDILISKSEFIVKIVYVDLTLDTLIMLFISFLLYAYLIFFENILMKILNYINMTITKIDDSDFLKTFSSKIEQLEIILQIYNGDPVKAVQDLNQLYSEYQQKLMLKNKNNANELNKKGSKKIVNNIENKKNEMNNIPKNQRIVTKKDIRNFHIIYNYLLGFFLILLSFLGSYGGLIYMWSLHSSREINLYTLIKKNFILESALYKSINIYDLMIFHNYSIDELPHNIFDDPNINKNEKNSLLKSFYEDLQYAFNSKKEKLQLTNKVYFDFENQYNFTCELLYEMNELKINNLIENSEIKNLNFSKENLIKICQKTRIDESNDVVSAFEYHFQYIKNGILSIKDFSYKGLINHINTGNLGKITVFFNCVLIYVLEITNNQPHEISINKINTFLNRNIIITEAIFIVLDFFIILVIFILFISNIKNYCNQIILLKKIFKIYEIQEQ